MNNPAVVDSRDTPAPNPLSPPSVRSPTLVQGAQFAFRRRQAMQRWISRHGAVFTIDVPIFGRSVVVCDPALVRSVCAASAEQLVNVQPNLSRWFGPGSTFGLDGDEHRERRRLLIPAFHGQSLREREQSIVDETLRESAKWPESIEFSILAPMSRITLNVILGSLFGPESPQLDELRVIVARHMRLGQLMAFVPPPPSWLRGHPPWSSLSEFRTRFDRIVGTLIAAAETDCVLDDRSDVLALLVRHRRDDGAALSQQDICDELLTLICAGHETTATALGWVFERLRRHPAVTAELLAEVDEGDGALRRAAILEALRVRPVIDVAGRRVAVPDFHLGPYRIPQGRTVLIRIADLHHDAGLFSDPDRFDPYRFLERRPAPPGLLAFGCGARRCLGADYAIAEMDVVLRTVLQNFSIQTDTAPDEPSMFRGIAHAPKLGGRVTLSRRA